MSEKNLIDIDEDNLVGELFQHSGEYLRQSRKLADVKREQAQAKAALDLCEAELDFKIRSNPADFFPFKCTEAAISNCIKMHAEFKDVLKKLIEAQHAVDIFTGVVRAFEHRKTMIESACYSKGQEWYSQPRVPKDVEESEVRSKVSRNLNKRLEEREG